MPATESLPDYHPLLKAYHEAYAVELQAMIDHLPVHEGDRVLDVACGDGFYSRCLAKRIGPTGEVHAVDILPEYLEYARKTNLKGIPRATLTQAAVESLPYDEETFDFVWCAQSLYSLPDPLEAIRQMIRPAKKGGFVGILENDTLHHILLPWPIEVELAIHQAEWDGFCQDSEHPRKFYVGRRLGQIAHEAGLVSIETRTFATHRSNPLGKAERTFLLEHLRDLRERVESKLKPAIRDEFVKLVDESSPDSFLHWSDLSFTLIDHVVWGVKPS